MYRFHFVLGAGPRRGERSSQPSSKCRVPGSSSVLVEEGVTASSASNGSLVITIIRCLLQTVIIGLLLLPVLYYCIVMALPLHWIYDTLPPAGPMSVYVPGAGFSGFWWHLGLLQAIPDPWQYEYYCYSSGCLSIIVTLMQLQQQQNQQLQPQQLYSNTTTTTTSPTQTTTSTQQQYGFETALATSLQVQGEWQEGNLATYDIVDTWLNRVLVHLNDNNDDDDDSNLDYQIQLQKILNRIHILITAPNDENAVLSVKATNRRELQNLLLKTTWIPLVTGGSFFHQDEEDPNQYSIDGGFSRVLHPLCEYTLDIPTTWESTIHSLNPALDEQGVYHFWNWGQEFPHPIKQEKVQQSLSSPSITTTTAPDATTTASCTTTTTTTAQILQG